MSTLFFGRAILRYKIRLLFSFYSSFWFQIVFSCFQQSLIPMTDFCARSLLASPTQKKVMLARYVLLLIQYTNR